MGTIKWKLVREAKVESGNWGVEGRESRGEGRLKTGGKSSVECRVSSEKLK
jgi:hypothetical protein